VAGASVGIALPELAAEPAGDLLQAGPLLVRDGVPVFDPAADDQGFSAGAHQFDDITRGRYPRAALGLADDRILAVVGDGRSSRDAGLTLSELAAAMAELGAETAINLDGGGSASLVYGGRLRNRPREEHGIEILGGRPIATAIVFEPRRPRSLSRLVRRGRDGLALGHGPARRAALHP
jgi:exopolysaccharide biosynthesis protein